eukprot:tig00020537_g10281.t1
MKKNRAAVALLCLLALAVTDAMSISSLTPANGPSRGGTQVTLFADNDGFGSISSAKCKFGSREIDAGATNRDRIVCMAPPADAGATVVVELSVNGGPYTSSGRQFTYFAEPVIQSISPSSGPTIGGTIITLNGNGFRDIGAEMKIGLGAKVVPARYVSPNQITFVTPSASLPAVDLPVEISMNNGADFSVQQSVKFTYYLQPILDRCNPAGGPVSGGTLVTIYGTQFQRPVGSLQYSCEFGRNVVPGTFVSENAITCVTPASEIKGPAPISISLNNRDYGNEIPFTYFDQPTIFSVIPRGGPVSGGDTVTLKGSRHPSPVTSSLPRFLSPPPLPNNTSPASASRTHSSAGVGFGDYAGLACKFGTQTAPVKFVDSQTIMCTTPPAVDQTRSTLVPVLLSLNGQDWSGDGQQSSDIEAAYRYYPAPSVTGLNPGCGPVTGNTVVQVLGTGFVNTNEDLRVRFGTQDGPATFVSDKALLAAAPAAENLAPGVSPVSVSMNFFDYRMAGPALEYHYYADPIVSSIEPLNGPVEGGTVVTVFGQGIDQQGCALACKFGTMKAVAAPLRPGAITCVAPKVPLAQSVPVEISLNDQDFTNNKFKFVYYENPKLANVVPRGGPESGNTRVTVRGSGFFPTEQLACRFGTATTQFIDVPATYVSPVEVRCNAPEFSVSGSAVVELRVSMNGRDWTPESLSYMYYDNPSVGALVPNNGPLAGGSSVTVTGSNFMNTGEFLKCRFGDDTVSAKFINSTALVCLSPGAPVRGLAPVEVSLNDADYTADKVPFNYASLQITTVLPASGPIAGGTLVTVKGFGFQDTGPNRLMCRFANNGLSNARYVDRETLLCVTPPYERGVEEYVPVSATLDGQDWTRNNVQFKYYKQPTVLGYSPAYGPVDGGTIVTVKGSDFEAVPGLSCRFGEQIAAATYISDTVVHCVSPRDASQAGYSDEPRAVPFGVALNQADFASGPGAFTYYRNVVPSSISPECGDVRGGTRVTVMSTNLQDFGSGSLTCSFGSVVVPVAERLSGAVVCLSPPQDKAGEISLVKVALNGRDFVEGPGLAFHYYAVPRLHYLHPNAGPSGAGTKVMVAGEFFPAPLGNSSRCFPTCTFGDAAPSLASYEASTRLWCNAPVVGTPSAGAVFVRVSFNGQDAAEGATDAVEQFTFYGNPALTSLTPPSGSIRGGTKVTVEGQGFPQSPASVTCRFGETVVPGRSLTPTSVLCVSPTAAVGAYPLEVSFNEHDFSSSGLRFEYYDITRAIPTSGPLTGGTTVSFQGKGFSAGPNLKCRFGKVDVPAQYVSAQLVTCQAPSASSTGLVLLGLTINGQTFDVAPIAYYYYYNQVDVQEITPKSAPATGCAVVTASSSLIAEAVGPIARYASFLNPACRLLINGAPVADKEATVDSAGTVKCNVPTVNSYVRAENNIARLEVALNGQDFSTSNRELKLYDVTDVEPKTGTVEGNAPITAVGYGFMPPTPLTKLRCMVGGVEVYSEVRDDQHVVCVAPPGSHGDVHKIQIAANGNDYTGVDCAPQAPPPPPPPPREEEDSSYRTRSVVSYATPNVTSVFPDFAPMSGSVGVTVTGSNFGPTVDEMMCLFGSAATKAVRLIDSSNVVCKAPAAQEVGTVPVRVSNNAGASFTSNYANFDYYATPVVLAANPTSVTPGMTVDVTGSGLLPVSMKMRAIPKCRFSDLISEGSMVSDTLFRCTVPAVDEGDHAVSISHNGVDFIGNVGVYSSASGKRNVVPLIIFLIIMFALLGLCAYGAWVYWQKNRQPKFIMEETPYRPPPPPMAPQPSVPHRSSLGVAGTATAPSSRRFDFGVMGTVDNRASLLAPAQPRSDTYTAGTYYSQNTGMTATTATGVEASYRSVQASYRPVQSTYRI